MKTEEMEGFIIEACPKAMKKLTSAYAKWRAGAVSGRSYVKTLVKARAYALAEHHRAKALALE